MGAFGSLLFVLALLGVVLHLLRRFTGGSRDAGGRIALEVLRRASLGPRQGVAVVRVAGRVVLLSTGEGGVHQLLELDAEDVSRAEEQDARAPVTFAGERTADAARHRIALPLGIPFADRLQQALRRSFSPLLLLALATAATRAAAQDTTTAPATTPPAIAAPTITAPAVTTPAVTAPAPTAPTVTAPATTVPAPTVPAPAAPATDAPVAATTPTAPRTRPLREGTPQDPPVARLQTPVQYETRGAGSVDPQTLRTSTARSATGSGSPKLDLRLGGDGDDGLHLSGAVGTIVMLGLLAMLPTLVLLMTSFTRILIVLQLLRQALGTQSAPPGHLIAAFALLLTGFVMSPTIAEANRTAIQPWLQGSMEQTEMLQTAVVPFRQFMLRQTREQDLATFVEMSGVQVASPDSVSLPVLVSAFATSELRSAFQIGFVLFLPFIIIDIVVAAVLMSMGMFMLPPAMISLPFKLLLFVLVDGWTLIVQSLVLSFR